MRIRVPIPFKYHLKFKIKVDGSAIEIIISLSYFLCQYNVMIGAEDMYLLVFVMIDPEGRT